MTLTETLKDSVKQSMRDKNTVALTALRGVLSAIVNEAVNLGRGPQGELSDDEVIVLLKREVKRRKDAIDQFTAAGRTDLADDDTAEVVVLEQFLPQTMSVDDIRPIVEAKIAEMQADATKIGQVIGAVMRELGTKADGGDVKQVVESILKP